MITAYLIKHINDWRGAVHLNMGRAGYGWIYRRDCPLDYKPEIVGHDRSWSPTIRRARGTA